MVNQRASVFYTGRILADFSTLGGRIRAAREYRKWSQDELARRFGHKGPTQISRWENNEVVPEGPSQIKLAKILGVPSPWLIDNEGPNPLRAVGGDVPRGTQFDGKPKGPTALEPFGSPFWDAVTHHVAEYRSKQIQGAPATELEQIEQIIAAILDPMLAHTEGPERARSIARMLVTMPGPASAPTERKRNGTNGH